MITIITAIYKSDQYLEKYVKRLKKFTDYLKDRGTEFEVIIIPQVPSEKESEILKSLSQFKWLKIIENSKPSLYAAWNLGVSMAKGDVIGFWNVDDVRNPAAVIDAEKKVAAGAELVYFPFDIKWYLDIFNVSLLVKIKHIDSLNLNQKECQRSMPFASFWMASKELFNKIGPFDEQFKVASDMDWTIRAALTTDKLVLSNYNAGSFRVDGNGLSAGRKNTNRIVEANIIYRRHNVIYKVAEGYDGLESNFNVKKIKVNDEYIDFNSDRQ